MTGENFSGSDSEGNAIPPSRWSCHSYVAILSKLLAFGSFVRDQVVLLQVTLNISATQSTAHLVVSGGGASRDQQYTMPPSSICCRCSLARSDCGKGLGTRGASRRRILWLRANP